MVARLGNRFLRPGPQDWVTHSGQQSHKDARRPPHCSCRLCCRTARESQPKLTVPCCTPAGRTYLARNRLMAEAISSRCVSSAKCPVSRNWTVAFGLSRRKASAPAGVK